MSIITKSLITKSNPIPMASGNRLTFTNANTSAQNKNGYLEYYNNIVWLRAAIQTIADAIAQSTWRLYKKKDGGDREEVTGAHRESLMARKSACWPERKMVVRPPRQHYSRMW